MRIKRAITVGALLLMSASLTACGGDEGNSDGDGKAGSPGLPDAADMASIEQFMNKYTSCTGLTPGDEYDDSALRDKDPAWGEDLDNDLPDWGIKERAVCRDAYHDSNTLVLVSDMKKFQAKLKAGNYSGLLAGKDFLVEPGDDQTVKELKASGLKYLSCDPGLHLPSGYKQEPALVEGCVLTDYFPAEI
ncbi:hypothetical protein [Streptomyces sp. NPDC002553]|uniref:hypothetical protein n=1 Tax=Streptomyces sp. NPDC002553 TaxID=3154417 RepID=UPI0033233FF9